MELFYKPRFPEFANNNGAVLDLHGAYNEEDTITNQYVAKKATLQQRLEVGDLGQRGYQRALKSLATEHQGKVRKLKSAVDKANKSVTEITKALTGKPGELSIGEELRRDRLLRRFEAHNPDERREIVRAAIEANNTELLSALYEENGLLDESASRRIGLELMAKKDRETYARLEELVGRHDYNGVPDPLTGALPVVSYTLDAAISFFEKEIASVGQETDDDVRARLVNATDGTRINGDEA